MQRGRVGRAGRLGIGPGCVGRGDRADIGAVSRARRSEARMSATETACLWRTSARARWAARSWAGWPWWVYQMMCTSDGCWPRRCATPTTPSSTARPRHEQPTATPEAIGECVGYGKCIHAARRYSFRGSPSSSRWWTRTGGCLLMRFTADGQVRQDPGSWPRAEGLPIEFEQVSTVA
jgi:hypothetical protein